MPIYIISIVVLHAIMLCFAVPLNPGTTPPLLFFAAAASLLGMASMLSRSFFGISLGVFLWLGLWLKFCVHLYLPRVLVEPVGSFIPTPQAYDQVMVVAGLAMVGAAVGIGLARWFRFVSIRFESEAPASRGRGTVFPDIAPMVAWGAAFILVAGVAWVNSALGIMRVGLIADVILPWPGNALISLFLTTGYFYLLALLLRRDMNKGRPLYLGLFVVAVAVATVSVSLLSRGLIVFHLLAVILPLAAMLPVRRDALKPLAFALVVSGIAFLSTIYLVQNNRDVAYLPESYDGPRLEAVSVFDRISGAISGLAVGRWVGLEGIMAVQSYEPKSVGLFMELANERSVAGQSSKYQYIAGSHYVTMNGARFQFATVPGPAAFFSLSGLPLLVVVGLCVMAVLGSFLEFGAFLLTRNVFATSFIGVQLANITAQFGITPSSMGPQFFVLGMGVLGLMVATWVLGRAEFRREASSAH